MQQGQIVELTGTLALATAHLSADLKLPMAVDSIMLSTARALGATLWTQDADFDGLDGVQFVPPSKR